MCEGCGAVFRRCMLGHGEVAQCTRCEQTLGRGPAPSVQGQVALAVAALVVFAIANLSPIVVLQLGATRVEVTLLEAVRASWRDGALVAALAFATAFACPLAVVVLRLHVLLSMHTGSVGQGFGPAARMLDWTTRWTMVEVFTLGALIAVSRAGDVADMTIGAGLLAFGALTVLLTAYQDAGASSPWHGGPRRRPDLQRSTAFLVAAMVLYLPANLMPVMSTRTPGGERGHTLFGGVMELWHDGAWDLAVIVFVASLVVPLTKMIALGLLILTASRRSRWRQRERARLYRLIDAVGHWSMLDVYVVVLLAGMIAFPPLAAVAPAGGLAAFGAVVVLTKLAVDSFDPRLIWPREAQ